MTPESSEQPRETRDGIPVENREAFIAGNASVLLKDNPLYQHAKVSSPELASLAAKYLDVTGTDIQVMSRQGIEDFATTVRSLAASVLAQAEGNPRK